MIAIINKQNPNEAETTGARLRNRAARVREALEELRSRRS